MTRGKYARRAENRRDHEDLAVRAERAEAAAAKLAGDLDELRTRSSRQVEGLTAELATARRAIEQGASPALATAEAQIRELRTARAEAEAKAQEWEKKCGGWAKGVTDLFLAVGMTGVEALEVSLLLFEGTTADGMARRILGDAAGVNQKWAEGETRSDQVVALQRSRGSRNIVDPVEKLATLLQRAAKVARDQGAVPEATAPTDAAVS